MGAALPGGRIRLGRRMVAGPGALVHEVRVVGHRYPQGAGRFFSLHAMLVNCRRVALEPHRSVADASVLEALWQTWLRLGPPDVVQLDDRPPVPHSCVVLLASARCSASCCAGRGPHFHPVPSTSKDISQRPRDLGGFMAYFSASREPLVPPGLPSVSFTVGFPVAGGRPLLGVAHPPPLTGCSPRAGFAPQPRAAVG